MYTTVGPLNRDDAAQALTEPAERFGAQYLPEALSLLVDVSDGYPYFLQTFGQAIWNLAPEREFTQADAAAAIIEGWEQLDAGFFPSRWERATPSERAYLHAMAEFATDPDSAPTTADNDGPYFGQSQTNMGAPERMSRVPWNFGAGPVSVRRRSRLHHDRWYRQGWATSR